MDAGEYDTTYEHCIVGDFLLYVRKIIQDFMKDEGWKGKSRKRTERMYQMGMEVMGAG